MCPVFAGVPTVPYPEYQRVGEDGSSGAETPLPVLSVQMYKLETTTGAFSKAWWISSVDLEPTAHCSHPQDKVRGVLLVTDPEDPISA